MVDEERDDISKVIDESRLIQGTPKIIDETAGLTQGTARVKSDPLKKMKKKKSKKESNITTNLEAIQEIIPSENKLVQK